MKKLIFVLFLALSMVMFAGCGGENTAEYRENLQSVTDEMFGNAAAAETLLSQYAKVWSYSIESRAAIPVSEMSAVTGLEEDIVREHFVINGAGNIPEDFSTNINSLNGYYEATGELEEIKEVSSNSKNKITELNNPPEDYKKVYEEVLDLYNLSEEYIGLALSPSGSLQSFNDNRNQLTTDILSKHKRIEVVMPNEE